MHSSINIKHKPSLKKIATFRTWVRGRFTLIATQIIGLIGVLITISSMTYYTFGQKGIDDIKWIGEFAPQIILVLNLVLSMLFLYMILIFGESDPSAEFRSQKLGKFIFGEQLKVKRDQESGEHTKPKKQDTEKLLEKAVQDDFKIPRKNFTTFKTILISYWIYSSLYYFIKAYQRFHQHWESLYTLSKESLQDRFNIFLLLPMPFILYYLLLPLITCNTNIYNPDYKSLFSKKNSLYLWAPIIVSLSIIFLVFRLELNTTKVLGHLIPISNTLILSLIISRIDSKLISIPSFLICALYGYSLIQIADVFLLTTESIKLETALSSLSLFFKSYFFIVIYFTIRTGRLMNYFILNGPLSAQIQSIRKTNYFSKA